VQVDGLSYRTDRESVHSNGLDNELNLGLGLNYPLHGDYSEFAVFGFYLSEPLRPYAARLRSDRRSSGNHPYQDHDHGDHQEHMDEAAQGSRGHQSDEPQEDEDDGDGIEHAGKGAPQTCERMCSSAQ
jgi:hypothetical protein